jgi:hypothetical protein
VRHQDQRLRERHRGTTLTGDDSANVLTGIADDKNGAASDWVLGNGGNDTIRVVALTSVVSGGVDKDASSSRLIASSR